MAKPLIIGISGGSGSGKTRFIKELREAFKEGEVTILSFDNYYKPIAEQPLDDQGIVNFDLPESLDDERVFNDLRDLIRGKAIARKSYTFNNREATPEKLQFKPAKILVVEGIFTFYFKEINEMLDLRIFIDAPDYLMLSRRIIRDDKERGYDAEDVMYRFKNHVVPAYEKYIGPLKSKSDLIIPNHTDFQNALNVLIMYMQSQLK